ncbi:hypothetical protein F908_02229 [Acinetobacter sp. NIPH 284]|nr:hypothetical protein F908_02229 [Acinetobacter sp. NIPH 284]
MPAPTAATLSGYPEHGSDHGVTETVLVGVHPCKTPQQYLFPPQSWHCHTPALLHDPTPPGKTLPPCFINLCVG